MDDEALGEKTILMLACKWYLCLVLSRPCEASAFYYLLSVADASHVKNSKDINPFADTWTVFTGLYSMGKKYAIRVHDQV